MKDDMPLYLRIELARLELAAEKAMANAKLSKFGLKLVGSNLSPRSEEKPVSK